MHDYGMEEVQLHSFLKKYPNLVLHVFLTDAQRVVSGKEIKDSFSFEENVNEEQQRTVDFLKKPTLMMLMVLKVEQGENMDDGWTPAFEREKIIPPTKFHR